ncbi:MAG: HEAT repeat domain-containing protein [Planctomycetota bacterium]|nr:HEAT repeat domain-containing protein [Planctomycetota bacterium]
MRTILTMLCCAALMGCAGVRAADPEKPKAGDPANDLPLELYKKIHGEIEAYYGVAPAGAPKLSKDEAKKALEADAKASKDALLKALNSAQTIHRELAAMALEFAGDPKGVQDPLCKTLGADPDSEVRLAAAGTLSNLADAAAVDALCKGLEDKDEQVRGQCVSGLAKVKDPRAVQPLLNLLKNEDKPGIRLRAAAALGAIKEPASLDALMKALDEEKDQRVRMAIASAVRAIRGPATPATENVPDIEEHTDALTQLGKDMRDVEEKLRGDRHDRAVQVDQKGIEEKLSKMIEQIEKMQQQSSSSSSQKKNQQQQQQQQQSGGNQPGQKQPSSPLADSTLGGGAQSGALNAADVVGQQADWAKLPPAERDALMQAYKRDLPQRWRKRLEAYYLSIAAEEAKANK